MAHTSSKRLHGDTTVACRDESLKLVRPDADHYT